MRTFMPLLALALTAGCDSKPAEKPVPMGSYSTSKYVESAGKFTRSDFGSEAADCSNDKAMLTSAFGKALAAMNPSGKPTLMDYGIDEIALADKTQGKIMAVLYSFEPGDPGAVSHSVDVFLFDDRCKVILMKTDPLD